jgi:hypothetical protein
MTAALELDQVTFRPASVAPEASVIVALNCWVAPGASGDAGDATVTFATAVDVGGVTEPSEPPQAMHTANVSDQKVDGASMAAPRL